MTDHKHREIELPTIHGDTVSFGTSVNWDANPHDEYLHGKPAGLWVTRDGYGTHIAYPEVVRLRDWLTEVIDAAGPRPLHPDIKRLGAFVQTEGSVYTDCTPVLTDSLNHVSERLYELDALKRGANG